MGVYVSPHYYTNIKSIFTQQFSGSSFVSPVLGVERQGRLNIKDKFPPKKNRAKPEKQKGKKEGGLGEGIFALLRLELERFRFSLIKRNPKAPTELPHSPSLRESSEPPRAPRVVSRGSVQKKLEFQPKGTANLQFQRFWKDLFLPAPAARSLRAISSGQASAARAESKHDSITGDS